MKRTNEMCNGNIPHTAMGWPAGEVHFSAKRHKRDWNRYWRSVHMSMRGKINVVREQVLENLEHYAYTALPMNTPWYWQFGAVLYKLVQRFNRSSLRKAFQRAVNKVKGL